MATPTPRPAPQPAPARPAVAPNQPKASRLGNVRRGLLREAKRFMWYGPEGVGKSTVAKDANAIFFDLDRGSGHLDVPRYPFRDGPDGHIAESYDEVSAGVDDLLTAPHDFSALAIDTSDALEALVWKDIIERAPVQKDGSTIKSVEDFGYGKGYQIAADRWRALLHRLDTLRLKRNMHIIFIGHSLVKSFKNPIGADYDRYRPKLDDRALGLLREWCDVVGFLTYDDNGKKEKGASRARGVSSGLRVIHLEHNAAWDAKSRLPLPAMLELPFERPWQPFADALDALFDADPDAIRASIEIELKRLGVSFTRADGSESTTERVRVAVIAAGNDASTLSKYLTALKQAQTKEA
jgi:hypothetical protein